MNSEERVKSRIAGRKMAKDLLEFLNESQLTDQHYMAGLIQEIARSSGMLLEAKREPSKQSGDSLSFEQLRTMEIPFGQYHGQTLDEVPLNYLDWLCQEQEQFLSFLHPYLKHPVLKDHCRDYDRNKA